MPSINVVHLIGNLTRDPQLKHLPNGGSVVEFGIALNRKFKTAGGEERDEVCFVDCTAFGKPGEVINQYCRKGKLLYIDGRLKFDSWDDKNGGGKRSKISVVVENFQFLGGREDAGGAAEDEQRDYTPKRNDAPPQRTAKPQQPLSEESPAEFSIDDVPF